MPEELMTRTETKGERKRTTATKQNTLIAHTCWQKLLHKFFPWALNRLLFSKSGLINRFFLCSGMKIEFLFSTGIK